MYSTKVSKAESKLRHGMGKALSLLVAIPVPSLTALLKNSIYLLITLLARFEGFSRKVDIVFGPLLMPCGVEGAVRAPPTACSTSSSCLPRPPCNLLFLLIPSLFILFFCPSIEARVWARVVHPPKTLQAVPEVHEAGWLRLHSNDLPNVTPALTPYWENVTIRPILSAVQRSANPWYTIRSLDPGTMGWHRVYRRRQRVPRRDLNPPPSATPPSTSYVSEEEEFGGPEGGDEGMFEYVDDESLSYLQPVWEERKRGAVASLGGRRGAEANPSLLIGPFMVLLITSSPFDPFSNHLEARVTQVAPAFPHVLFLKGEGKDFSGLVAQISVKGLPQVLLFEENLLRGRFRGVKTVRNLLSFLVLHTGCLPRAVVTGNGEPEDKLMVSLPMVDEPGLGWIYALSVIWVLGEWILKLAKMGRKERRATNSDEEDEKQE